MSTFTPVENSDLPSIQRQEKPGVDDVIAGFLKRLDAKLDSVLAVNARLMKENIKLTQDLKRLSRNRRSPSPPNDGPRPCPENRGAPSAHECSQACFGEKNKIIAERNGKTDEISFTGKGTFDAKEIIKTLGSARFDSPTKAWILKPNKTLEFIREQLSQNFDYQFLE